MTDYLAEIMACIDGMESDVNSIVWPEAEKDMKKTMLERCAQMNKIITTLIDILIQDKLRSTTKILTDCNTIEDLMYARGRLAQIKKVTGQ